VTETEEAILTIIEQWPGATQLELLKVLYLADIESRRLTGESISDFNWIRYHNGPFSTDIYSVLESLKRAGVATTRAEIAYTGKTIIHSTPVPGGIVNRKLPALKQAILNGVALKARRITLKALMNVAYATPPMQSAQLREPLNMALVDNTRRGQITDDLMAALNETPDDPVLLSMFMADVDGFPEAQISEQDAADIGEAEASLDAGEEVLSNEDMKRLLIA